MECVISVPPYSEDTASSGQISPIKMPNYYSGNQIIVHFLQGEHSFDLRLE